jgi:CheY-like chemotaxis protein
MDFEVRSFVEPVSCCSSESIGSCSIPCADIVITDFRMPQQNGIELLSWQRQCGCTINVRNIAIVSGNMPEDCLPYAYEVAGMFFNKPFSLEELGAWAMECISRTDLTLPLSSYFSTYD